MAIRVEFYAENQMIASNVVEFALSRGAVLQSYGEIEPPLKRKPKASRVIKRAKSKRVPMNRTVQCVNSDFPFRKNSALYKAAKIIVRYNEPTPVNQIYAAIKKAGIDANQAYPAMRKLLDIGHVVVVQ